MQVGGSESVDDRDFPLMLTEAKGNVANPAREIKDRAETDGSWRLTMDHVHAFL